MKHRVRAMMLALLSFGAAFGAESGIEFSGVLGGGRDLCVALTDRANGSTQWVSMGSSFAGYTVTLYDAKTDVLVLTKEGQSLRLSLRKGKAATAEAKPSPELERAILNNLRQLAAAADQYYLENGKTSVGYDELVGPTKYVRSMTALNGENYRALQFAMGRTLTVTTASGHTVSYSP